ncbi:MULTISPECIES: SdpI family protein [unclassified Cryobacterium]|uniref:SdpI family protein n=1 Tax=unclassified Cryobacterium TaxID=2649013 RepID=UPI000CE42E14|nr:MULTISPECIES: SdpI family protein [unclassified Cryobacterium]
MGEEAIVRVVLFVVMVGSGVLLLWMAQAAASGRLGRNQVAGIRLPLTMASDSAWLAAHVAAKRPIRWAGWCSIAAAVPSVLPVPLTIMLASSLIGAAGMITFTLYGASVGSRAARALSDGE